MVKYIGTVNNSLEIGIDVDDDGQRDLYFGFYYDKKGKYAGYITIAIMVVTALLKFYM